MNCTTVVSIPLDIWLIFPWVRVISIHYADSDVTCLCNTVHNIYWASVMLISVHYSCFSLILFVIFWFSSDDLMWELIGVSSFSVVKVADEHWPLTLLYGAILWLLIKFTILLKGVTLPQTPGICSWCFICLWWILCHACAGGCWSCYFTKIVVTTWALFTVALKSSESSAPPLERSCWLH